MRWLLALISSLVLCASAWADDAPHAEAARQMLVMLPLPKPHFRAGDNYGDSYDNVTRASRVSTAEELARRHGLELQLSWPIPLAGVDCFVMRLPDGDPRDPAQVAQAVAEDRRVAWVQPMNVFRGEAGAQKSLYAAQPAARQWQLAELHKNTTGRGARVAVIDSGVELNHPDLAGQVAFSANLVDERPLPSESHGTAVAGIIAARTDTQAGIAGIAPRARLLALRACWQAADGQTLCNSLGLARAFHLALQEEAHIINLSLGGPEDRLLSLLVEQALARGVAVVAAQPSGAVGFPAKYPGVLVVASQPPLPAGSVIAPGRDVPSTAPLGAWALVSGSSFAAAHASGLLALAHELDPRSTRGPAAKSTLVTQSDGRIDGCATLARLMSNVKARERLLCAENS